MIIFKKMFAEKILRFHEAMNRFSELLMRMPHLGDKIKNPTYKNLRKSSNKTMPIWAITPNVIFNL